MTVEIPNLWPVKEFKLDVISPLAILRAQATRLQEMTQGILEAQVTSSFDDKEDKVSHQFNIVAPALGDYSHRILTAIHAKNMFYPVTVYTIAYLHEYSKDGVAAYSQEQWIDLLRKIFASNEVIAVIQSLIARSNDPTGIHVSGENTVGQNTATNEADKLAGN